MGWVFAAGLGEEDAAGQLERRLAEMRSAGSLNSTAIGFGAAKTIANQSGTISFVTTDEDGNLGTTGTVPPGGSSKSSDLGTSKPTASTAILTNASWIEDGNLDTSVADLGSELSVIKTP